MVPPPLSSLHIIALTGRSVAYSSYHSRNFFNCDLFLLILVTCMKLLNYCKIVEENFNFVVQEILEGTWLIAMMVFPEPWVIYSLKFSHFSSFLHKFIWSYRYNINRPKSKNEHKYSKYKKCLRMIMLICITQHLNNN